MVSLYMEQSSSPLWLICVQVPNKPQGVLFFRTWLTLTVYKFKLISKKSSHKSLFWLTNCYLLSYVLQTFSPHCAPHVGLRPISARHWQIPYSPGRFKAGWWLSTLPGRAGWILWNEERKYLNMTALPWVLWRINQPFPSVPPQK